MAFFDDMANAVRDYPDNNVVVEIINFDVASGDALNEAEQATFKVRITNSGLLNMSGVTLEVKGDRGTGTLGLRQGQLVGASASNTANGEGLEDVFMRLVDTKERAA